MVSDSSPAELCARHIKNKYPNLKAVYHFGSSLDYEDDDCSDIDIAVLLDQKVSDMDWFELKSDLCLSTKRDIDLIQLRKVSIVFQNEIISKARRIYAYDDDLCTEYEALILSLYQKLNEERAEILEEISKTKKVYDI